MTLCMTCSREHELELEDCAADAPDGGTGRVPAVYVGKPAAPPRTLWEIFGATVARCPKEPAIDDGAERLDYAAAARLVEQLADRLTAAGIGAGDYVGIRVASGSNELYLCVLAVLAVGAAYVPVDVGEPVERAELVWAESRVCAVLETGGVLNRLRDGRGAGARRPAPDDDAWVIFTSGTTGKPKGVAVTHRSAAAFVDAEHELFTRLGPGDRVLASLSVAFDASCEEMWLAWRNGACLVPARRELVKTGAEFAEWLITRGITVVSTVPTLAGLWPDDVYRNLRLLILGGEACSTELADRLAGLGIEVWNTYGPTETTVVACGARLRVGEPVRIGLPLAGWQLAVLDPQTGEPVGWGDAGELVISGAGVARYLDPARDAERFVPVPQLRWARAYRSGDLVRADPAGLVYLHRTDSQVKLRGYRIELGEIEAVLGQVPGIAQAAVTTVELQPGLVELAAYYSVRAGEVGPAEAAIRDRLRNRLPAHMVPAFLERIAAVPTSASGKVNRAALPRPARRLSAELVADGALAETATERALAAAVGELLGLDQVPVQANLFTELGANSLLVARLCAVVRRRGDCPPVATREVYLNPTIRQLASAIDTRETAAGSANTGAAVVAMPSRRPGRVRYALCGAAQLLTGLAALAGAATVGEYGFTWITDTSGIAGMYLRGLVAGLVLVAGATVLPIAAKWLLIGRWRRMEIALWGISYYRFWLVKSLVRASPLSFLAGSPLYVLYLRALGARIGRGTLILSRDLPVCTDLIEVGAGTVIRRNSSLRGYRAEDGVLRTGPVSVGARCFIGEQTVLDIDTRLGDDAQLGHSSALYSGQRVPAGQRVHGSPAVATTVDYQRVPAADCPAWRRALFGVTQLAVLIVVALPVGLLLGYLAFDWLSAHGPSVLADPGADHAGAGALGTWGFYRYALLLSAVLFVGGWVLGAVVITVVPRLLRGLVRPERTYPLYGVHHLAHRVVRALSNAHAYLELTGDSSYVIGYLRAIGYRLPGLVQTGSNFGAAHSHDDPFGIEIAGSTMVSDGATLINAEYSSSSFRVVPLRIGRQNFLGTGVAFPAGARTGDNCLIGSRALVPLDGPVRENVGLLGSPAFEIPRTSSYDPQIGALPTGARLRELIAAKNRHNLMTMALFLVSRWVLTVVMLTVTAATCSAFVGRPPLVLAALTVVAALVTAAVSVLIERASLGFRRLPARRCSIYDRAFWGHERYWKLLAPFLHALDGTPFKAMAWRLLGVRVGRQLFDDGCALPERSLVRIGDFCTLNHGSIIQCHSMEDGAFKSDFTEIGSGSTIGVGALVHYGVTLGERSSLQVDSFLMKGETVPPGALWGGNPAAPTTPSATQAA
jgi:non-ribosomal peptide synthetase-like protein